MNKISLLIIFISSTFFSQNGIQTEKSYYESGNIKSEISFYVKDKKIIREGKSFFWYQTGELKNIINYKDNQLSGERISYWKNGELKRKDFFKNGKLKSGKCFDENGKVVEYYDFEIQPEFPGGNEAFNDFIKEHLVYNNSTTEGKLIFKFTIEVDGKVSNLKILKDTNPSITNEVNKMFKIMPIWKPAIQDGIPVKVTRTIPITFK
jgi:hypothetical protein